MTSSSALLATALTIGVTHTLIGVDHSLPFILLGRARGWTLRRTLLITTLCGAGHVLSSVVLGAVGIGLGVAVGKLEWIESTRGELAAWLMIGFGLAYATWGLFRGRRGGHGHSHLHLHDDGTVHQHPHVHAEEPREGASLAHAHETHDGHPHRSPAPEVKPSAGPVVLALFVVFVVGPCEALIPLLMVPAFETNLALVVLVTVVFGVATIGTMLAVVTLGYLGLQIPRLRSLEAHLHTVAGLTIAAGGVGIQLLGI